MPRRWRPAAVVLGAGLAGLLAASCQPVGEATTAAPADPSPPTDSPERAAPAGAPAPETARVEAEGKPADASGRLLIEASSAGDAARVRELIAAGADVDARNDHGSTALYVTVKAENPSIEIAQVLLEAGANPDIPCSHGFSPASICASRGQTGLLRLLLAHGAVAVGETGFRTDLPEAKLASRRNPAALPFAAAHFATWRNANGRERAEFSEEVDGILDEHFSASPPPSIAGQITGID